MNFSHIHTQHVILIGYCIAHFLFLFLSKDFIQKALSEKNQPSALRLTGFIIANGLCFWESWHVLMSHKFLERDHLLILSAMILLLYSVIKMAQVIEFKNGKAATPEPLKKEDEQTNL